MNFAGRQSLRRTLCAMPIIIIITLLPIHLQRMQLRGAFHSTKISGNFGSKSNGTESFVSKISVHLLRLSFFWKFGNSRKFLFHLAFLPRMNQSEFLYSWKATRWRRVFRVNTELAAKWSAIVRVCSWSPILHENVRIWFPGKLWTGHSEFPVGHFARFAYSPARKVRKFLS